MQSFETTDGTFIAKVHPDGLLQVFAKARSLTKLRAGPEGVSQEEVDLSNVDNESDRKLLEGLNRMPMISATYAGDRVWNCDVDAGFQRLRVARTGTTISCTMKKWGFKKEVITRVLSLCRKHKWDYCPRQW